MSATNPKRAVERYDRISALGPCPPARKFRARAKWLRSFAAIMALDLSEAAEVLRDVYPREVLLATMERPNPLFALLRKNEQGAQR